MPEYTSTQPGRYLLVYQQWSRDVQLGMQNLLVHGMRSLLTMLGMIFGVAAVVAMLSIGAGARQKVMALIEQMGVHNLIVEAKETVEWQAHQKIRKLSQGLTLQDYRVIHDDLEDIVASTPRKQMTPSKIVPRHSRISERDGSEFDLSADRGLHVLSGRFFDQGDDDRGSPVCVLAPRPSGAFSVRPIRWGKM